MTFEKPNLEKGESAEAEPLMTREQVEKAIENIHEAAKAEGMDADYGKALDFVTGELEKVRAAKEAGMPVEERLMDFLLEEYKEDYKIVVG